MQVLQAGQHKFIYLELQPEMVASIARQAGFETRVKDSRRTIHLDLSTPVREGPLLLFDAADPANLAKVSTLRGEIPSFIRLRRKSSAFSDCGESRSAAGLAPGGSSPKASAMNS